MKKDKKLLIIIFFMKTKKKIETLSRINRKMYQWFDYSPNCHVVDFIKCNGYFCLYIAYFQVVINIATFPTTVTFEPFLLIFLLLLIFFISARILVYYICSQYKGDLCFYIFYRMQNA